MRFSTNLRDPKSYEGATWAQRDRPPWLPEPAARILLDRLDWPIWGVYAAAISLAAVCVLVLREVADCIQSERRHAATRALLQAEKRDKQQAQLQGRSSATAVGGAAAPATGSGLKIRVCRFCDVHVEDAHVVAHESGKKHRKLRALATALDEGESCWVWQDAPAATESTAPPATPSATDALEAQLVPNKGYVAPVAVQRKGGGDGGKGAWSKSGTGGTAKRRR